MRRFRRWLIAILLVRGLNPADAFGQIDPVPRQLLQVGYNAAFQGHAPLSAYAFYYWNKPEFIRTNFTLRMAIAPTYIDSELGIRQALGDDTDLGIGVAGGGFADSYDEIRRGVFHPGESFVGHGAEVSASLYHCLNPSDRIPLNAIVRAGMHYSVFTTDEDTDKAFTIPDDRGTFLLRTGLRWGGKEPILFPSLAMELSAWYEAQLRTDDGRYGFNRDRKVEPLSHLFWGQALLAYTLAESHQSFFLSLTLGTSLDADRFSAYRLGALLPLVSEFPLSLPGYYYQEISARQFVLFGGNYLLPLDAKQRWNINIVATTAAVDYLDGLEQPGQWHSGVGGGILYQTESVKMMVGYAYGVDAIRTDGRGAHSVGVLMQMDLDHAGRMLFSPEQPSRWRGFQRIFGVFNN
ncbi:MAG TPA: hypothetical protein GYA07_06445 [Verrucomicrobia bacterium]|nr:hypothetical protein [Verrucomicrobiota bacterium]HOB31827.1 hypothetical protein [Verrucomicrobiota bacterium]HOP95817.1 hypothetical protein [Verrucomicrobiota bacterium]HPU56465.1 hypothetical protein [Verrucomicrobiota bacterium]